MRKLRYGLWVAVAVFALVLAVQSLMRRDDAGFTITQTAPAEITPEPGEPLGKPFVLADHNGARITEAAFRGQPTAVFFGFTHCPEICPTTLYELNGWIAALGADGERLAAYFVTVDPERDTVETLKSYVTSISDRIIGISGEPAAVQAMLKDFHVYFKKVPLDAGGYIMDHTASIFLLDSGGRFVGTITYDEDPEIALAKLKRLVER